MKREKPLIVKMGSLFGTEQTFQVPYYIVKKWGGLGKFLAYINSKQRKYWYMKPIETVTSMTRKRTKEVKEIFNLFI